jgi:hypothetical protein
MPKYDQFTLGRMRYLDLQVLLYQTRPDINDPLGANLEDS